MSQQNPSMRDVAQPVALYRFDPATGEYHETPWRCSPDGAAHVADQTVHAGDRNSLSTTESYKVVRQECNLSVISKTTAVTLGGGNANDTHLMGIIITAALTGSCVITGFNDSDGTAQSITLPASTPAGFKDFMGALNSGGALTVTCSNSSDDNLVSILWKAA